MRGEPTTAAMDVLEAIDSRASALRLSEPAPSTADLDRILAAAVRAPDHGRLAPWRFVVLEAAARERLGDALAALLRRKQPDAPEATLSAQRAKALRAPTIVVVVAHVERAHKVPEIEQLLAVGAGVQNMLLAAHALGYGAMWRTGAAAYDAQVKSALGIDADDHIVGFVYLGTVAAAGTPRAVSLDGLVRHL